MRVTILGKITDDESGFAERLGARAEASGSSWPCEVRWAGPPGQSAEETLRVRDAAAFLARFPDPLVPVVYGVVALADGVAVVQEAAAGHTLRELFGTRIPEPAWLSLWEQVADWLHRAWTRRDPHTNQPLHFLHRNISADTIRLRADGRPLLTGFDALRMDVQRAARTSFVALRPGLRILPEHPQHLHTSDVSLLASAMFELMAPSPRFAGRMYALSGLNADAFEEGWARLIAQEALPLSEGARLLLLECLRHDPAQRPDAGRVANAAQMLGANGDALASWSAAVVAAGTEESWTPHLYSGEVLELPELQLPRPGGLHAPSVRPAAEPPRVPQSQVSLPLAPPSDTRMMVDLARPASSAHGDKRSDTALAVALGDLVPPPAGPGAFGNEGLAGPRLVTSPVAPVARRPEVIPAPPPSSTPAPETELLDLRLAAQPLRTFTPPAPPRAGEPAESPFRDFSVGSGTVERRMEGNHRDRVALVLAVVVCATLGLVFGGVVLWMS